MTAACLALSDDGLSPQEIGERIGREASVVTGLLSASRRGLTQRRVMLPFDVARSLGEQAEVRGITGPELAVQLLDVVVRDELFEALLGEPEGCGHG